MPLLLFSFFANGQIDKQLGIEYFKNQEYDKAVIKFKYAYNQQPSDEIYKYMVESYIELKQLEQAQVFIKKHIRKNNRRSAPFYIDLGYVQTKNKQPQKAEASFNEVFKQIEKNPNLAYSMSQKFSTYGFYEEALKAFETAESVNPNLIFDFQKAEIYANMGDVNNMYRAYLTMIDKNPAYYNNVLGLMRQTVSSNPQDEGNILLKELIVEKIQSTNNPKFNDLLAWVLIQEKSFSSAFIQLKALDKRLQRNQAEIYNLGQVATKNKDWKTTDKCYDYIIKVGEVSPFYEDAILEKSFAHQTRLNATTDATQEDFKLLLAEFENDLKTINYPEDVLRINRAIAEIQAYKLMDYNAAVATLETVLKKYPAKNNQMAKCKILLGDILLAYGNPWDALLYYAQVDKAFDESELGQEARFKKAMIAFYEGDFDWAKTQFDVLKTSTSKLISNDAIHMSLVISDNTFLDEDSNFTALKIFAKAKLYVTRQALDSALILLQEIEENYPTHTLQDDILWERAQIYVKQNKIDDAVKTLEDLLAAFGQDLLADQALYELARIYEEILNDPQKAMDYYQELFSDHGDSILASPSREKFRQLRGDELYN